MTLAPALPSTPHKYRVFQKQVNLILDYGLMG